MHNDEVALLVDDPLDLVQVVLSVERLDQVSAQVSVELVHPLAEFLLKLFLVETELNEHLGEDSDLRLRLPVRLLLVHVALPRLLDFVQKLIDYFVEDFLPLRLLKSSIYGVDSEGHDIQVLLGLAHGELAESGEPALRELNLVEDLS